MFDATSLRDCEVEALAHLGLVQPHGGLLVLDAGLRVQAASAGLGALLGTAEPVPGEAGIQLLGLGMAEALAALPLNAPPAPLKGGPAGLEVVGHRNAEGLVVEWIRPTERAPESVAMVAEAAAQRVEEQLRAAPPNLFAAAQLLAEGVARLSGYDRVMVYRFHPDWSGEVIAERRKPDLPPYLGLRYPASDIPSQARSLYARTPMRIVADTEDVPQPLRHAGEQPPDLSGAVLRSVSPMHVVYLRNMGVRASLSVSLMHRGRLWGLLACHHDRPRLPAQGMRALLAGLAEPFAAVLDRVEEEAAERRQATIAALRGAVLDAGDPEGLLARLLLRRDGLAFAAGADGVAWVDGERLVAVGLAPDPATLRRLAAEAHAGAEAEVIRLDLPAAEPHRLPPAGMLAALLPRGWLALFRREEAQEVNWAGDPAKPAETGPDGRLSPRRSFALWKEQVRGACRPWDDTARALLAAAAEMIAASPGPALAARAVAEAVALAAGPDASPRALPELLVPRAAALLLEGRGAAARLAGITPALAALLGVPPESLRGLPWAEAATLLGLAPVPGGEPGLHAAFSPEHGPLHLKLVLQSALQVAAPGTLLAADLLVAEDQTREGRLAEALQAAGLQIERQRQARDAFLAQASHELRTPLSAILGHAELLGTAEGLDARHRRQAGEIGRAGRAMLALVETLLAVTRLEAGRLQVATERFDLAELLGAQARLLAPLFDAKPVRLTLALPPAAPWVGDPGLLAPVVLNLLGNALKFTPPRGEVTLSLTLVPGVAEIRVADTGPGVPPAARARIFEAFEQVEGEAARHGAGLGLFIARSMVLAMGGSLALDSPAAGGSVFVVRLPLPDLR
jgi:light-regulated signal transduction histidine kinase (bacteriophytochrome)